MIGLGILDDDPQHGFLFDGHRLDWHPCGFDAPAESTVAEVSPAIWARIERPFLESAWLSLKRAGMLDRPLGKLRYPWPISSILGKELAVLIWASHAPNGQIDRVIRAWSDLHPTERWWLYTMGCHCPAWQRGIQAALSGET